MDGVSFSIARGEVVGLVGEFGCGKSTVGRLVAGLLTPTGGTIRFRDEDIATSDGPGLAVQMVFQDPYASLNPRKKVASIVGEAVGVHRIVPPAEVEAYVDAILERCGIERSLKRRFPHQFSGGQRQRIGIARALAVQPELLVVRRGRRLARRLDPGADPQPVHALKDEIGLTYLFISHDLGVVRYFSDRVVVMYLGRIVEQASTADLFASPEPSLHARAPLGGAAHRPAEVVLQAGQGRDPVAAQPADGMPLPPALSAGHAALRGRAAGAARDRARPPVRLPPEREGVTTGLRAVLAARSRPPR